MAKFGIHYRGVDGAVSSYFSRLAAVAKYVKARDLGAEYRRPNGLQLEYGFLSFSGFEWGDIFNGSPFSSDVPGNYKPELINEPPRFSVRAGFYGSSEIFADGEHIGSVYQVAHENSLTANYGNKYHSPADLAAGVAWVKAQHVAKLAADNKELSNG